MIIPWASPFYLKKLKTNIFKLIQLLFTMKAKCLSLDTWIVSMNLTWIL